MVIVGFLCITWHDMIGMSTWAHTESDTKKIPNFWLNFPGYRNRHFLEFFYTTEKPGFANLLYKLTNCQQNSLFPVSTRYITNGSESAIPYDSYNNIQICYNKKEWIWKKSAFTTDLKLEQWAWMPKSWHIIDISMDRGDHIHLRRR